MTTKNEKESETGTHLLYTVRNEVRHVLLILNRSPQDVLFVVLDESKNIHGKIRLASTRYTDYKHSKTRHFLVWHLTPSLRSAEPVLKANHREEYSKGVINMAQVTNINMYSHSNAKETITPTGPLLGVLESCTLHPFAAPIERDPHARMSRSHLSCLHSAYSMYQHIPGIPMRRMGVGQTKYGPHRA